MTAMKKSITSSNDFIMDALNTAAHIPAQEKKNLDPNLHKSLAQSVQETVGIKDGVLVALRKIDMNSFICFCPFMDVNFFDRRPSVGNGFVVTIDECHPFQGTICIAQNNHSAPRRFNLVFSTLYGVMMPWCGNFAPVVAGSKANCFLIASHDGLVTLWSKKKIQKGQVISHEGGQSDAILSQKLLRTVYMHYRMWNKMQVLHQLNCKRVDQNDKSISIEQKKRASGASRY